MLLRTTAKVNVKVFIFHLSALNTTRVTSNAQQGSYTHQVVFITFSSQLVICISVFLCCSFIMFCKLSSVNKNNSDISRHVNVPETDKGIFCSHYHFFSTKDKCKSGCSLESLMLLYDILWEGCLCFFWFFFLLVVLKYLQAVFTAYFLKAKSHLNMLKKCVSLGFLKSWVVFLVSLQNCVSV